MDSTLLSHWLFVTTFSHHGRLRLFNVLTRIPRMLVVTIIHDAFLKCWTQPPQVFLILYATAKNTLPNAGRSFRYQCMPLHDWSILLVEDRQGSALI